MALYSKDSVERVREAADMIEVVGARVELRRAGADRYTGRCPFHDDRSPSFGISPSSKVYHCFGCGAGGDLFRYVQETEGLDFKGAVELLADRYGVQLEVEDEDPRAAERRQRRGRLYELLERTAAYYVRVLWESDEAARAREYLASRGLDEATLRAYRVGYAPSRWDSVLLASQRAGFGAREAHDAGLVQRPRDGGRVYDRFRSQITFPLCDARGRVLGFAGRRMDDGQGPKYVNSPEGELFHKGRMVFGADLARAHAAKAGTVIAVEGYTDVLMLHQAGLRNAVAVMGTALTEEQLAELSRLAGTVLLALDADSAGQEAMVRAQRVAAGRKVDLRVVPMPEGLDPAEVIARQGAEAMRRAVEGSVPFVAFRVERALATGDLTSAEGKDQVLEVLRPVFAALPPSVLREDLLRRVADRMDLDASMVAGLLAQGAPAASAPARPSGASAGDPAPPPPSAGSPTGAREAVEPREERTFLAYCVALPRLGEEALRELDLEGDLTSPLARRAAIHLREHISTPAAGVPEDDESLARLVAELTVRADRLDATPAAFEAQRLQLAVARADRALTAARREGRDLSALARRRSELKARHDAAIQRAMDEARDPESVR